MVRDGKKFGNRWVKEYLFNKFLDYEDGRNTPFSFKKYFISPQYLVQSENF